MKCARLLAVAGLVMMSVGACERADGPPPPPAEATSPSQTPPAAPPEQNHADSAIVLEAGGLKVGDRTFAFDTPADGVLAAVMAQRPGTPPSRGTSPECGPGPLDYARWDDLTLWFQNGRFAGWESSGPILATTSGAHAGMTRPQLEAAGATDFDSNSLGIGFSVGEVYGIIGEGESTAAVLFSGANCFAA